MADSHYIELCVVREVTERKKGRARVGFVRHSEQVQTTANALGVHRSRLWEFVAPPRSEVGGQGDDCD